MGVWFVAVLGDELAVYANVKLAMAAGYQAEGFNKVPSAI